MTNAQIAGAAFISSLSLITHYLIIHSLLITHY